MMINNLSSIEQEFEPGVVLVDKIDPKNCYMIVAIDDLDSNFNYGVLDLVCNSVIGMYETMQDLIEQNVTKNDTIYYKNTYDLILQSR